MPSKNSASIPHTTVVVRQVAPSQALPALASFFVPGLGQLIQGRVLAAMVWFCLFTFAVVSMLAVIGIILTPIVWLVCIIDAAKYRPAD
jgi:hypothetical protein